MSFKIIKRWKEKGVGHRVDAEKAHLLINNKHYILSQASSILVGHEIMLFKCTKNGKVKSYLEYWSTRSLGFDSALLFLERHPEEIYDDKDESI
jgi:ribosomal protein L35